MEFLRKYGFSLDKVDINGLCRDIPINFIIFDVSRNLLKDYEYRTTRNTVEAIAISAATIFGGSYGYLAGSTIANELNVSGTICGVIGGVFGAWRTRKWARAAIRERLDAYNYDMVRIKRCLSCKKSELFRIYRGQKVGDECPDCVIIGGAMRESREIERQRNQQQNGMEAEENQG
uniref:Gly-zipper_Omp domain-containing protein n=1 Tax=Caenorhabditis tropicalis TaxID=1561998 RepID=A0A1I7UR83_9PELO